MPVKCEKPCLSSPEGRGGVTLRTRKEANLLTPHHQGLRIKQDAKSGLDHFSEQLTQNCISAGGAGAHRLVELTLLTFQGQRFKLQSTYF